LVGFEKKSKPTAQRGKSKVSLEKMFFLFCDNLPNSKKGWFLLYKDSSLSSGVLQVDIFSAVGLLSRDKKVSAWGTPSLFLFFLP